MADEPETKGSDTEPEDSTDYKAEAERWKAHAQKHEGYWKRVTKVAGDLDETSLKALVDKAKQFDELSEKDKTEQQKLTDKVTVAEKAAIDAEMRALRAEVALEKGLSGTLAKRLTGSTKEELESDADELLTLVKPDTGDKKDPPPDGKPKPDLKGGGDPEESEDFDPDEVLKKIRRL